MWDGICELFATAWEGLCGRNVKFVWLLLLCKLLRNPFIQSITSPYHIIFMHKALNYYIPLSGAQGSLLLPTMHLWSWFWNVHKLKSCIVHQHHHTNYIYIIYLDELYYHFLTTQILIPSRDTTYWCAGFQLPEDIQSTAKHMIRVRKGALCTWLVIANSSHRPKMLCTNYLSYNWPKVDCNSVLLYW